MKKVVRLTESDLIRLIQKVLNEQTPQPKTAKPAPQNPNRGPGFQPKPFQPKPAQPNPIHTTKTAQKSGVPKVVKLQQPIKIAVYDGKTPFNYDLTGVLKDANGCTFNGSTRGGSSGLQKLYWTNATPLTVSINRKPYKITEKASGLLIKACGTNEYASVGQGGESNYA